MNQEKVHEPTSIEKMAEVHWPCQMAQPVHGEPQRSSFYPWLFTVSPDKVFLFYHTFVCMEETTVK